MPRAGFRACLLLATSLQCFVAQAAPDYDLLVLRQDWQTTSCPSCPGALGAFTIYELTPSNKNSDDPYQEGNGCKGPPFDSSEIPASVTDSLNCIFASDEGNNAALWEGLWDTQGKCSGMSISSYFSAVASTYSQYTANTALANAGLSLAGNPYVDRDRLLSLLASQWGVKPWLDCTASKQLRYVSICLDPGSLAPTDCPWDPNSDSEGGRACAGPLLMSLGIAPPQTCSSYFPKLIPGAVPAAAQSPVSSTPVQSPNPKPQVSPPPAAHPPATSTGASSSSDGGGGSSNIGLIVGVVAGVLLAAAAAIAGFVLWRRRAARRALLATDQLETKQDALFKASPPSPTYGGQRLPSITDTFLPPGGPSRAPSAGAVPAAPVEVYRPTQAAIPGATGRPPLEPGTAATPVAAAAVTASMVLAAGRQHGVASTSPYASQTQQTATPACPFAGALPPPPAAAWSPGASSPATSVPGSVARADHAIVGSAPSLSAGAPSASLDSDPLLSYVHSQLKSGASSRAPTSLSGASSATRPSQNALWAIPFEQISVIRPVGEGSFGRVYLGEWQSTSVAVKLLLDSGEAQRAQELSMPSPLLAKVEEEADIMLSLRHPNCVALLGLCASPPCLVTEYMERGSLTDCLREARQDPAVAAALTWHRRLNMAMDGARGMVYLHSRSPPIVHRDLKGPNLLVDRDWRVKISDFNLSKFLSDSTRSSSIAAMNPRWLAPEVMQGERASQAADVFSFAVVMWELLTWELPWASGNAWQLVSLITQGGRLSIPPADQLPGPDCLAPAQYDAYVALIRRCWAQNQFDRPSFADIIVELRRLLEEMEAGQAV